MMQLRFFAEADAEVEERRTRPAGQPISKPSCSRSQRQCVDTEPGTWRDPIPLSSRSAGAVAMAEGDRACAAARAATVRDDGGRGTSRAGSDGRSFPSRSAPTVRLRAVSPGGVGDRCQFCAYKKRPPKGRPVPSK